MSYMLPMVEGQPNRSLMEQLSATGQDGYLEWLDERFSGISLFRKIRLISAYETQLTKTAQVRLQSSMSYYFVFYVADLTGKSFRKMDTGWPSGCACGP